MRIKVHTTDGVEEAEAALVNWSDNHLRLKDHNERVFRVYAPGYWLKWEKA